jgi:wyosine [tRNA(Phe)-imidazoG37] synthetase (radical SAM superfamily)
MKSEGPEPNVLTFAGNGEPTLHPDFPAIVDDVIALRNRFFPDAKVSVLSNATRLSDPEVFKALLKVDNNIQKLDTVDPEYIRLLNCPAGNYNVESVIDALCEFKGHVIIQTIFLSGTLDGRDMDNTADHYVLPWIEALKRIAPSMVMIYTIDRETPVSTLRKASRESLNRISSLLEQNGLIAQVSY